MLYAMTEIKVILAYLLCRVDYDIDPDYLNDQYMYLGLEGTSTLPGKITRKFRP